MSIVARKQNGELVDLTPGASVCGQSFVSISMEVSGELWSFAWFQQWLRDDLLTRLARNSVLKIEVRT